MSCLVCRHCDFFTCRFNSYFYCPKLLDVLLVVIVSFSFYSCRQSLKHQAVIKSQLKHKDIVTNLCENILVSFQSCLQFAEQMTQSDAQVTQYGRTALRTMALISFEIPTESHLTLWITLPRKVLIGFICFLLFFNL